ncbi:MAG: hypothetical protein VX733_15315 [Candidatus Latescibacterota bacterium]|nr:hypothetical protein [Candidatus Latescibacterota bacterium]
MAAAITMMAGCAYLSGLIPRNLKYELTLDPQVPRDRGDIYVDLEDSSFVYSHEGAFVKVMHLDDDDLDRRIPKLFDGRHVNPYTREDRDPDLRYIPPRFTVFEVKVINETYAKIEFDPAKTVLTTDSGAMLRYYDPGRAGEGVDPLGGNRFSEYYKTEIGRSGLDKDLNLERIGVVYKTAYHRHRPVFREDERVGYLVFDPLPEGVASASLKISAFALRFDADNNPKETVDVEFTFSVDQTVIEIKPEPTGI